MAPETKEICSYLKEVLNFRNFIEIPDNENNYFCISNEELKSGRIKPDDRKEYLLRWMPKKSNFKSDKQDEEVEILLIPKFVSDILPKYSSKICLNKERAWEYRKVSLLYIKAKCNIKTMEIIPVAGESIIWSDPIIKNCFSNPFIQFIWKLNEIIFNKKDSSSVRFELKRAPGISENGADWQEYISKVEDNFRKRTGKDFFTTDALADENGTMHKLYDDCLLGKTIVMKDDTVFATSHIVNLLSHIVTDNSTELPLLEKMLLDRSEKKSLVDHMLGIRINRHLGQMKNDHPLANAQRDAVHCFSNLKDGEVLAVSGPPGTGKTTMLKSIVADMLVRTTIKAKNDSGSISAPLILATSANNKAITNIIDDFSSSNEDTNNIKLDNRWLCYEIDGVERFLPIAVYMPSSSVDNQKTKNYFITDYDGGGNYGALRLRYFKDPSDFYNRANTILGGNHKCADTIMHRLSEEMDSYLRRLNEINNLTTCKTHSFNSIKEVIIKIKMEYEKNEKVTNIIDSYLKDNSTEKHTETH